MPAILNTYTAQSPEATLVKLEQFRGVDLTSGEVNVSLTRSPDAQNMMPSDDGFPVKRHGFRVFADFSGTVHGGYRWKSSDSEKFLVHAGNSLYLQQDGDWNVVCSDMADASSNAYQLGSKLWIIDGEKFRYFDGNKVGLVSDIAVAPTVTIGKNPKNDFGGTSYQPVNLLTGRRKEEFLSTGEDSSYYLSFENLLPDTPVIVSLMNENGDWTDGIWTGSAGEIRFWEKDTEGNEVPIVISYTVDRENGIVKFTKSETAYKIPATPVTGVDNVRIAYEIESNADVINKCRFGVLYGVGGELDRLFLSGNPDEPNIDRWSEFLDPSFFGDISYSTLGTSASSIVGYSILGNSLVTHKVNEENDRNAFVRTGTLDDSGFAVFSLKNVITGTGAVSDRTFINVNSEPLFLTMRGLFALTPSDLTGERYAQNRSYYINGAIQKASESDLRRSVAVVWKNFAVIAISDNLYLLDTTKKSYDDRASLSEYQFDAWNWTGITPCSMWVWDDCLYIGTENGTVLFYGDFPSGDVTDRQRYYRDYERIENGQTVEEGRAFEAYWTTPLMTIGNWSYKKNIKDVFVATQPYHRTSGYIYYRTDKDAEYLVKRYVADLLDWNDVDFNRFSFRTLRRPYVIHTGKKAKKVILFQIRVASPDAEPLGIYAINFIYTLSGKVKQG